jgi:hypothetical protein
VIWEIRGEKSATFATAFGHRGFSMVRVGPSFAEPAEGTRPRLHRMHFVQKYRTGFR